MNYSQADIVSWINSAPPTELTAVGKQLLTKITTLPQASRDQFTRDVGDNQAVSKLFNNVTA